MYGDNLPDGFTRDHAIAAGIVEEHPGFESYLDLLAQETEGYEDFTDAEREEWAERALAEWLEYQEEARGEAAAEREEYERTTWDGYEPW